jgi:hypothetical protein
LHCLPIYYFLIHANYSLLFYQDYPLIIPVHVHFLPSARSFLCVCSYLYLRESMKNSRWAIACSVVPRNYIPGCGHAYGSNPITQACKYLYTVIQINMHIQYVPGRSPVPTTQSLAYIHIYTYTHVSHVWPIHIHNTSVTLDTRDAELISALISHQSYGLDQSSVTQTGSVISHTDWISRQSHRLDPAISRWCTP